MRATLAEVRGVKRFEGYAQRAWYAWHCKPRDKFGKPPAATVLEVETGLHYGELLKLLHGEYSEPSWRVAKGAAAALQVDVHWLMDEEGTGPDLPYGFSVPDWPGPRPSSQKRKGRQRAVVSPEIDTEIDAGQADLAAKRPRASRKKAES